MNELPEESQSVAAGYTNIFSLPGKADRKRSINYNVTASNCLWLRGEPDPLDRLPGKPELVTVRLGEDRASSKMTTR